MRFKRNNYEGLVFGTRQIVRDICTPSELVEYFGTMPCSPERYRMAKCLNCGREMPVLIGGLRKNPPKRCAMCSGINNHSVHVGKQNIWRVNDECAAVDVVSSAGTITAYVDRRDYALASSMIWRISKKKNKLYLVSGSNRKGTMVYLHQLLIGGSVPNGYEVDHIDGNSLNNRRDNLRVVTRLANIQNSKARHDNKIGIRGVSQAGGVYIVDFCHHPHRYYFKHWKTLQDAVYCRMFAEQHFDLHILENNPVATEYLTASPEYADAMRAYVESVLNTAKAAV